MIDNSQKKQKAILSIRMATKSINLIVKSKLNWLNDI